ncbi:unnamed protein product [Rotaria socialis]
MQYPLKTFSIAFRYYDEEKMVPLLSSIMFHNDLRKFEYKGTEEIFNKIQWPISYHIEHLTVFCDCRWRTVCSILSHLRSLRTLALKGANKYESDKFIDVQPNITQSTCLTSLSLETYTNITMNDIESLLLLLPKLTHLRLIGQDILTDPSLFDGCRWENFIKTKLTLLNRFEFWFTRYVVDNVDCTTVESLIATFRTSFWLETKHWCVKCDHISGKYRQYFYLYSIPISLDIFQYPNRYSEILHSILNTTDDNSTIIVETHALSLDLSKTVNERIQHQISPRMNYWFQSVVELTLEIEKNWPANLAEYLSTILNLSSLQTIHLDFKQECQFVVSLDNEVDTLFKHARDLISCKISCHNSERMKLITFNAICLKLPRRIKYLQTDITYVDDAKILLEQIEHLSHVTFQNSDAYGFAIKIIQQTPRIERDLAYEIECYAWIDDYPRANLVHFWLGKSINKQLSIRTNNKRMKRVR